MLLKLIREWEMKTERESGRIDITPNETEEHYSPFNFDIRVFSCNIQWTWKVFRMNRYRPIITPLKPIIFSFINFICICLLHSTFCTFRKMAEFQMVFVLWSECVCARVLALKLISNVLKWNLQFVTSTELEFLPFLSLSHIYTNCILMSLM